MASIRVFVLAHDQARAGVAEFAQFAPAGTVVDFREPTRTSAINAALHAKLGEIADTREWAGRRWDVETWKRLLVAAGFMAVAYIGGQHPLQLTTAFATAVAGVYMGLTVASTRQIKEISASERERAATMCERLAAEQSDAAARRALIAAADDIRSSARPNA